MQETSFILNLARYLLKLFGLNAGSGSFSMFFLLLMTVFFIFVFISLLLFFEKRRKESSNNISPVKNKNTGTSGKTDAKNVFNNTIKR